METIGIMRVHDFPLTLELVIPGFERHVDGFCFLFDQAPAAKEERLRAHPKCVAAAEYGRRFSPAGMFRALLDLALPLDPEFIINFDEDQILPARFGEELERFKRRDRWSMQLQNFEHWGSPSHIVADKGYKADWHTYVMRCKPGMKIGPYRRAHTFDFWYNRSVYRSPYPVRHLAFMTTELRMRRRQRALVAGDDGPDRLHGWAGRWHPTIPYDPDMKWKDYLLQAKSW